MGATHGNIHGLEAHPISSQETTIVVLGLDAHYTIYVLSLSKFKCN